MSIPSQIRHQWQVKVYFHQSFIWQTKLLGLFTEHSREVTYRSMGDPRAALSTQRRMISWMLRCGVLFSVTFHVAYSPSSPQITCRQWTIGMHNGFHVRVFWSHTLPPRECQYLHSDNQRLGYHCSALFQLRWLLGQVQGGILLCPVIKQHTATE